MQQFLVGKVFYSFFKQFLVGNSKSIHAEPAPEPVAQTQAKIPGALCKDFPEEEEAAAPPALCTPQLSSHPYLELGEAEFLRHAWKMGSTCETSSRGAWHMFQACTSSIWDRTHPGTASSLISLSWEQSHTVHLTCAADRGCPGICLCTLQEDSQPFSSLVLGFFKNESVLTNCSDIPRRLCRSISGFGAAFQYSKMIHRCGDVSFFQFFSNNKPHQEEDEGKNKGENEEPPFSGSGWWSGELPAS